MNARATNNALLKVLGITEPLITALQIQMHPTNLPVVTMEYLLDGKALEPTAAQFDLVLREEPEPAPAPAPALDLNAMCAAARATLASEVEFHGTTALTMQRRESAAIRTRLDQALLRRRTKVTAALTMLDLSLLMKALARSAAMGGFFGGSVSAVASPSLTKAISDSSRFESIGLGLGGGRK